MSANPIPAALPPPQSLSHSYYGECKPFWMCSPALLNADPLEWVSIPIRPNTLINGTSPVASVPSAVSRQSPLYPIVTNANHLNASPTPVRYAIPHTTTHDAGAQAPTSALKTTTSCHQHRQWLPPLAPASPNDNTVNHSLILHDPQAHQRQRCPVPAYCLTDFATNNLQYQQ